MDYTLRATWSSHGQNRLPLFAVAGFAIHMLVTTAAAADGTALLVSLDHKALLLREYPSGVSDTIVRAEQFGPQALVWGPRFSPDGTRIAFSATPGYAVTHGTIYATHNDGTNTAPVCDLHDEWVGPMLSWCNDHRIYWSEYGSHIFAVDLVTRQRDTAGVFSPSVLNATVSLDGTRAAASVNPPGGGALVVVYDLLGAVERVLGPGCQGSISPDGVLVTHNQGAGRGYVNHGWATIDSFSSGAEHTMFTPPPDTGAVRFNLHRFSRVSGDHLMYQVEETRQWYLYELSSGSADLLGIQEAWDFYPGTLPSPPTDEPVVHLSSPGLVFSSRADGPVLRDSIVVSNAGAGLLGPVWVDSGPAWLSSTVRASGADQVIVVQTDPAGLQVGAYHARLGVGGGGAFNTATFSVSLNIDGNLNAPWGVTAAAQGNDSVRVSWHAGDSARDRFVVQRSSHGGVFGEDVTVDGDTLSWQGAVSMATGVTRYRVFALLDTVSSAPSDTAEFTSQGVAGVVVTAPAQGAELFAGDTVHISWLTDRVTLVALSYSLDGGQYWEPISDAGVGTSHPDWAWYPWVVPEVPTDSCYIEVADYFWTVRDRLGPITISPSGVRRAARARAGELPHVDGVVYDLAGRLAPPLDQGYAAWAPGVYVGERRRILMVREPRPR